MGNYSTLCPHINKPTITTKDIIRPTLVEIDLKRLTDNYHAIKSHVGSVKVMPILKANAYGHGLVEIARLMQHLGANCIGVAVLEEGILLRENGITIPILVLGGILGNQVPHFFKHNLTITASSEGKLIQINEAARDLKTKAKVHLKIDTGMERIGVHYYNAEKILETSLHCKHVEIEGIFSHLADGNSIDLSFTQLQYERFQEVLSFYEKRSIPYPVRHIANSGAILQHPELNLDMVRPGILLYGVYPSNAITKTISVKPALSWKSRVVYFKIIEKNNPVGYGSTWKCNHSIHAVTVPVGYGDGYFRSMSHKAHVIIHGKRYPVIGTISMDQIVINLENDSAFNDDEVVLIGDMDASSITCEDLAEWAGTIPYEILTNINTRVPRIYK